MIMSSPKNNNLWKLYQRTRLRPDMAFERELIGGDRCLLKNDPKMAAVMNSGVFVVIDRTAGNLLLTVLQMFPGAFRKAWINPDLGYGYNLVNYYNGDKPEISTQ